MDLKQRIIERIKSEGPISFRNFMEMALYEDGLGYYTSLTSRIGKEGDFYTSSNVSPAFGAMIAKQISEMISVCNAPVFTIVEYGAGNGTLCRDILAYLKTYDVPAYEKIQYAIIEKSPALRAFQNELLKEKVSWYKDISELKPLTGCVLSNELVDNFSVHQVVMEEELKEVFVDYDDKFFELLRPASSAIRKYFEDIRITLPQGFRTEVCLDAIDWLRNIADSLESGYLMTIDYGYTSFELYSETRRLGTLVGYHKHKVTHDLYDNIGEQDITAHVNFSALAYYGDRFGFEFAGYRDQGPFLKSLGFINYVVNNRQGGVDYISSVKKENFIMHTLLEDMGRKFKVLVLRKNVPAFQLSGFKTES
jgi:SAM-dependent MidA family methyltransferase